MNAATSAPSRLSHARQARSLRARTSVSSLRIEATCAPTSTTRITERSSEIERRQRTRTTCAARDLQRSRISLEILFFQRASVPCWTVTVKLLEHNRTDASRIYRLNARCPIDRLVQSCALR